MFDLWIFNTFMKPLMAQCRIIKKQNLQYEPLKTKTMATYKITWEIDIEADNPLEAAKFAENWLQDPNNNWQYYVQNDDTKEIFSVDLQEHDSVAVVPVENYVSHIK